MTYELYYILKLKCRSKKSTLTNKFPWRSGDNFLKSQELMGTFN